MLAHTAVLGENGQELAVWVGQRNGTTMAGYSWGDQTTSISSYGMALKVFLPETELPDDRSLSDYFGVSQLPPALAQPAIEWIRQQAETRLQKKGEK